MPPIMIKMLHRLLWLILSVFLIALLGTAWLGYTQSGRDLVLAQLQTQLTNQDFDWQKVEGTIASGLHFYAVDLQLPQQNIKADHLYLNLHFNKLLLGHIHISRLELDGITLSLQSKPTDERSSLSQLLPRFSNSLAIDVAHYRLSNIQLVHNDSDLPLSISSITGGVKIADGSLLLTPTHVLSDQLQLRLQGQYQGNLLHAGMLTGQFQLKDLPQAINFQIAGDHQGYLLRAKYHDSEQAFLLARAYDQSDTLRIDAHLLTNELAFSNLGLKDKYPISSSLQMSYQDDQWYFFGQLQYQQQRLLIAPSRLRLADQKIVFDRLDIALLSGLFRAEGQLDLQNDSKSRLLITTQNLCLPTSELQSCLNANIEFTGGLNQWQANGNGIVVHKRQSHQFDLSASGNQSQASVQKLSLRSNKSSVSGKASIAWRENFAWQLELKLQQFNPALVFSDWPGAINGPVFIRSTSYNNQVSQTLIRSSALSGSLRNKALSAQGQVLLVDNRVELDLSVGLANSFAQAKGQWGDTTQMAISLKRFNIADFFPDYSGQLQGDLSISGPAEQLSILSDISANKIAHGNSIIDNLSIHGQLSAASSKPLIISARGIRFAGELISELSANLSGPSNKAELDFKWRAQYSKAHGQALLQFSPSSISAQLNKFDLSVDQQFTGILKTPAQFDWSSADGLHISDFCLNANASHICVAGDLISGLRLSAKQIQMQSLSPMLSSYLDLPVYANGAIDLTGLIKQHERSWLLDAQLTSDAISFSHIKSPDIILSKLTQFSTSLRWLNGTGNIRWKAQLDDSGVFNGQLSLTDKQTLDGELTLKTQQLLWMELLSPDIIKPKGTLTSQLFISGSQSAPKILGDLQLNNFSAELPALGLSMRKGQIIIQAADSNSATVTGSVDTGDGLLQTVGQWHWQNKQNLLSLAIYGERVRLANTVDLKLWVTPSMTAQIGRDLVTLRGRLDIPEANINLETLNATVPISTDVRVVEQQSERQKPTRLDAVLALALGDNVQLKGYGLDAKLGGELKITDPADFAATARGVISTDGSYQAYGQSLQIKTGRLIYNNAPLDSPELDILAIRDREAIKTGLQIRGNANAPRTTIWSEPAMNEAEALSWLILGRSLNQVDKAEAEQLGDVAQGLSASNALVQSVGVRLGLDDAGVIQSRTLGGSTFQIGKYISPRLYLGYGISLIGNGQVAWLRYRLNEQMEAELETGPEQKLRLLWKRER